MPILIGTSTKNQKAIPIGETQMNRVYVGDKLVWQKPSGFTEIKYGALYNWPAVTDSRNLTSSDSWTVLSDAEWTALTDYLGGLSVAGGKLKDTDDLYWIPPNTGATNESGFMGRGAGYRKEDGQFLYIEAYAAFWSSTNYASGFAWDRGLSYNSASVTRPYLLYKTCGESVRLKYTGAGTPTSYTGNDGKIYRVVTINGVTYLAENLAETKFRNGDWITGYSGGTYTPISNANWAAKATEAMCIYGDVESNMLL